MPGPVESHFLSNEFPEQTLITPGCVWWRPTSSGISDTKASVMATTSNAIPNRARLTVTVYHPSPQSKGAKGYQMSDSSSSVELVLNKLLDGIRQGHYVPGQRLVAGDVAKELKVSRAPVREAIHVLAGEGVVELTPNQGARIVHLTSMDLVHGMLMLKAVGALGIEYACANMRLPGNRGAVKSKAKEVFQAGATRQPYPWFNGLIELHRLFNDISGNPYPNLQVFGRLHLVYFNRALAEKLPGRHWEKYVANYHQIVDLVLEGDAKKAVAAFNSHMNWAIDGLRKEYLPD